MCALVVLTRACGFWAMSLIDELLSGEQLLVEAELREVRHALGIKDAVQVVAFVLDNARVESFRFALERFALDIEAAVPELRVARDDAPHARHRQTSFPILLDLAREDDDF